MNRLIFLTIALATYVCFVEGQACTNPNGVPGECKSLYDCQPLLDIVNNNNRTPQQLEFVQKAKCGFVSNTNIPTVCCANQQACINPDGEQGTCVDIYQCEHLAAMLQPPVSQQSITYLQNSRCVGSTQTSICCGPKRIEKTNGQNPSATACAASVSAYPPDPSSECCGIDSRVGNKIFGGNVTTVDQYPWLVLIEYFKGGVEKHLCGGALISGKYVLTAGHCVVGDVLKLGTPRNVRLAEYDKSNEGPDCAPVEAGGIDCTEGMVRVPIERTIPHPEYNPANSLKRNDIALIRLRNMAPFTDFIRPICLPTVDLTQNPPFNFTLYAAGWGAVNAKESSSSVKLHVDLPFVNSERCQTAYSVPGLKTQLWTKQLCAGGQKGKDSCKGDSGGPLMYENGKYYEATGVVSFGPLPCGMINTPGVYTKVIEYKAWILSNISP